MKSAFIFIFISLFALVVRAEVRMQNIDPQFKIPAPELIKNEWLCNVGSDSLKIERPDQLFISLQPFRIVSMSYQLGADGTYVSQSKDLVGDKVVTSWHTDLGNCQVKKGLDKGVLDFLVSCGPINATLTLDTTSGEGSYSEQLLTANAFNYVVLTGCSPTN